MKRILCLMLASIILILPLTACVVFQVKPWERDLLAERQMQLIPDALESSLDEHTYFSKEAASGGQGVGGGGCGCN
ncbi:MAG TPA: DUF4266 domain-containing protein [Gammaproteobacteria bacterium]|nr:DUF4266 domain-containing protein [Gammaproteobacteria bacterium]